jgi:hypothetical protein
MIKAIDKTNLRFECMKPVQVFIAGITATILSLYFIITRVKWYVFIPEEIGAPPFDNTDLYMSGLPLDIILAIMFGIMIIISFKIVFPPFLLRILDDSINFTIRKQSNKLSPPRTLKDVYRLPNYLIRVKKKHIPFEMIAGLWYIPYKRGKYVKGGFVVILDHGGMWYIITLPATKDINQISMIIQRAMKNRIGTNQ